MNPSLPGGPASSYKYVCQAEGCGAAIRASDLAGHYDHRTNYVLLSQLRTQPVGTRISEKVDKHTKYMFENNHSKSKLPNWRTHKREKNVRPPTFLDQFFGGSGSTSKKSTVTVNDDVETETIEVETESEIMDSPAGADTVEMEDDSHSHS